MKYMGYMIADNAINILLVIVVVLICQRKMLRERKLMAGYLLYAAYLSMMLNVVGFPSVQYLNPQADVNLIPFSDAGGGLLGFILNAVMFVPFGFLVPVIWKKWRSLLKTGLAGFCMSLFIEVSQLLNFRASDVDDLLANTLGSIAGYTLASLITKKFQRPEAGEGRTKDFYLITAEVMAAMFFVSSYLRSAFYMCFMT